MAGGAGYFDYVEIGTSDFDALIQSAPDEDRGLSIEPVPLYLDRLPERPNCTKLNAAISDHQGWTKVFFIAPEVITRLGLPDWVRGCNSIDTMHPTVTRMLRDRGLDPVGIVAHHTVPVKRLADVLVGLQAAGVYLLKIDTEGHDPIILADFFAAAPRGLWPHRLQFETNVLSDSDAVQALVASLIQLGYDLRRFDHDAELHLNLRRARGGGGFSAELPGYYLAEYPEGLDPGAGTLPYDNTLPAAQDHCVAGDFCGVTFQYGRYEVRKGAHLMKSPAHMPSSTWVRI